MKKYLSSIVWLILAVAAGYLAYRTFTQITPQLQSAKILADEIVFAFVSGFAIAAMIYNFMYKGTSESLDMYKRELEKKSIGKEETSSKVKVLESKIEVLEKALEDALKK